MNRHVPFGTRDFKSRASANFATRAFLSNYRIIQDSIDRYPLSGLRLKCHGVTSGVTWSFLCRASLLNQALDCRELVRGRKMRITTGHTDGLVSHQLLYSAQIHAVRHEATGKRVPDAVPCKIGQSGFNHRFVKPAKRTYQRLPVLMDKSRYL